MGLLVEPAGGQHRDEGEPAQPVILQPFPEQQPCQQRKDRAGKDHIQHQHHLAGHAKPQQDVENAVIGVIGIGVPQPLREHLQQHFQRAGVGHADGGDPARQHDDRRGEDGLPLSPDQQRQKKHRGDLGLAHGESQQHAGEDGVVFQQKHRQNDETADDAALVTEKHRVGPQAGRKHQQRGRQRPLRVRNITMFRQIGIDAHGAQHRQRGVQAAQIQPDSGKAAPARIEHIAQHVAPRHGAAGGGQLPDKGVCRFHALHHVEGIEAPQHVGTFLPAPQRVIHGQGVGYHEPQHVAQRKRQRTGHEQKTQTAICLIGQPFRHPCTPFLKLRTMLRQHRIILRADTASEKCQLLSKKRR